MPYRLAGWAVKWLFFDFGEVEALYIRHSFAQGDWRPGLSDIDLFVVIKDEASEDLPFLLALYQRHRKAKLWAPMLGEVEVATARQLNDWLKVGGVRALEAGDWILCQGQERREQAYAIESRFRQQVLAELLFLYAVPLQALLHFPGACPAQFAHILLKIERTRGYLTALDPLSWSHVNRADFLRLCPNARLRNGLLRNQLSDQDILELVAATIRRLQEDCADSGPSQISDVAPGEPPRNETWTALQARLADSLADLKLVPGVEEVILSNGPVGYAGAFGNHNYRLYVVIADDCPRLPALLKEVKNRFRRFAPAWPHDYFGLCSCPLVVTRTILAYLLNVWSPAEIFYLQPERAPGLCPKVLESHFLLHYRYMSLYLRNLLADIPLSKRIEDDQGPKSALIDHTLALAMQRAWWQGRYLATTPSEALAALRELKGIDPEQLSRLTDFHRSYACARLKATPFDRIRDDAFVIIREQTKAIDVLLREYCEADAGLTMRERRGG